VPFLLRSVYGVKVLVLPAGPGDLRPSPRPDCHVTGSHDLPDMLTSQRTETARQSALVCWNCPMDEHTFPTGGDEALLRGRELLAAGDREGAEQSFRDAVRLGAADAPWWITQAYLEVFDARAGEWMRQGAVSLSTPGGITVDPGTLPITTGRTQDTIEDTDYLLGQVWCVALTDCDPQAGAAALRAAKHSLYMATADGRVPSDEETLADTAPCYANCVWVDEAALTVTLDAKDAIMPMLARVVLTVLVEELQRAGVTRARLYTPASAVLRF